MRVILAGLLLAAAAMTPTPAAAASSRDARAPVLLSGSVTGSEVRLTFSETLRARALDPTVFRVSLNGRRIDVRSARAAGRTVRLALAEPASSDDLVTVALPRAGGSSVPSDLAGNRPRAFDRVVAVRGSRSGCAPWLDPGSSGRYELTEAVFGNRGDFAPSTGDVRAIALFVDFSDAPASESTESLAAHVLAPVPHWYAAASYGRLRLRIDRLDTWLRVPRRSLDYGVTRELTGPLQPLIADAVAAADARVDFRSYHLVYVLASRDSQVTYSPALVAAPGGGVVADGVELRHGAVFGRDTRPHFGSSIAVHETGHALGLPDLYSYALDGGRSDWAVGGWDNMSTAFFRTGFLAWQRWKLRWLDRGQLRCYRGGGALEVELAPLDAPGGVKAVVVPVDASRAWVFEARRRQGLDAHLCSEGVLAYLVDAQVRSGSAPIRIRSAGSGATGLEIDRCGMLHDAPYDLGAGRTRLFTETSFRVEVLERTASGGYRIRASP